MLFKPNFRLSKRKLSASINRLKQVRPSDFSPQSLRQRNWRKYFTWRKVIRAFIILFGVGIVFAIGLFAWYFKDLPHPGELRTRSTTESTILYDRNGKQIYDISGDERRILLKNDEIPKTIKDATVSIEDHNFYSHHGVDFLGVLRGVILKPLTGHGVQGGSTITQQYVKNAILSPKRSITRKIKELILSMEIEAIYSKDDILSLYLNEIPYGSNIYGVEAASQSYFGHSAKDGLTVTEAATLAAIPQAPTRYSPYGSHVDALITRRNIVLDDMAKYGYIKQDEVADDKQKTPLASKDFAQKPANFPAPHFVMYVREQLVAKYGEDLVQRGGLRVTTTLDLDLQKKADDAVKNQGVKTLPKVGASNAGLVAMDPKTGQILAMVGSLDYFDREHEGNFNVATASRQPGSSIKPIVYSTLLKQNGWSPGSVLWDVQTDFNNYKPNNFDGKFHGPLTIRKALGNSFNIPAVKALGIEGIPAFLDQAKSMGITTLGNRTDVGLSLALGAGEVKLVDLASAYTVLANGGQYSQATPILKIQDSKGKVLDEWKASTKQVLPPEVAYEISNVLSDVEAKKPTFTNVLGVLTLSGRTVAVKTGTSNNFKDAWTMGYTPSIVTGVWAGNNNGDEMDHGGGSTAAAPIWKEFMTSALQGKPNELFSRPDSVVDYTVDMLSGKKPTSASGQLVQDLFAPWQLPTKDDDVHTLYKVCKSNGLLATDATPAEEVEQRAFSRVRSEKPDNPAWEGPVQAWAHGNNLVSDPPTQKCDLVNTNPKITITSPDNGAVVNGIFTVSADVTFPPGVSGTVDFTLDGSFLSTDNLAPFTATVDTASLGLGSHDIAAIAHANNGNSDTTRISVTVARDTTPPAEASSVILAPGTGKGTATATWVNPTDPDLASVTFYVSQTAGVKGARLATIAANPSTTQNTTLTGLISGVVNYITLVTTDSTGNANTTTHQYTVTPL